MACSRRLTRSPGRGLRGVVIKGNGKHFQAGADLKWIDAVRSASLEENIRISRATAPRRYSGSTARRCANHRAGAGRLLRRRHRCRCRLRRGDRGRQRRLLDRRGALGLTAAIIIPQLNDAIGVRQMRRYALTGERFDAEEARRIGLVHQVVPLPELAAASERMIGHVLENGPDAVAQTKAHTLKAAFGDLDEAAFRELIERHAAKRRSPEAAEGLASFAESARRGGGARRNHNHSDFDWLMTASKSRERGVNRAFRAAGNENVSAQYVHNGLRGACAGFLRNILFFTFSRRVLRSRIAS